MDNDETDTTSADIMPSGTDNNGDGEDNPPEQNPETRDNNTDKDANPAEADTDSDMNARITALESAITEISQTLAEIQAANAKTVLGGSDESNDLPDEADALTDEDANGTYLTFDDLYEKDED
jgi:hypothetical protein|nr:MAG TPA: hypothetical protein [Caudoviricetes sp.]